MESVRIHAVYTVLVLSASVVASAGLDVLRANGVPGVVYVATGLSTGEAPMWWDAIEDRLLSVPEIDLPDGRRADVSTAERKEAVFKSLRKWVFSLPPERVGPEVTTFKGFVTPSANPLFLPWIAVSEYRGFPRADPLPRLRIRLALKGLFGAFAKGTGGK